MSRSGPVDADGRAPGAVPPDGKGSRAVPPAAKGSRAVPPDGRASSSAPRIGRVVGIDLGTVRIGVAVSDAGQRLATGLTVVSRSGDADADRKALAVLAANEGAVAVVVGLPRSMDGSVGPAARAALEEVERLQQVVTVPVEAYDERLTTVTATQVLQAGGTRGRARRGVVDQVAAAVMLQSWLDGRLPR